MSADGDIVREALERLAAGKARTDDALVALARLEAAAEDNREAVLEIAEYSESDSPNDLPGAVAWLIREDTRHRIALQHAVAQRDTLAEALRFIAEGVENGKALRGPRIRVLALAALAEAGME